MTWFPPGEEADNPAVDPLKYQRPVTPPPSRVTVPSNELMTVKVRYKHPDGDRSTLVTVPVVARNTASPKHAGFAAAVAEFGMLLRDSEHKGTSSFPGAAELARRFKGDDPHGHRAELIRLIEAAAGIRLLAR